MTGVTAISAARLLKSSSVFHRGRNAVLEIGKANELLQIGPAEQCPLHEIEMPVRVGVRREALEKGSQERIGIEVDSRRGFVLRRDKAVPIHPPMHISQAVRRKPSVPPQRLHDRHGLRCIDLMSGSNGADGHDNPGDCFRSVRRLAAASPSGGYRMSRTGAEE